MQVRQTSRPSKFHNDAIAVSDAHLQALKGGAEGRKEAIPRTD